MKISTEVLGYNDCSSLLLIDNRDNSVVGFRGYTKFVSNTFRKNKYQQLKEMELLVLALLKRIKSIPKGFGLKLNKALENVDITVATCFGGEISLEVHKMNKFNINITYIDISYL